MTASAPRCAQASPAPAVLHSTTCRASPVMIQQPVRSSSGVHPRRVSGQGGNGRSLRRQTVARAGSAGGGTDSALLGDAGRGDRPRRSGRIGCRQDRARQRLESGIVSATVRVDRAAGEPVMVTTRYGAPPSPERTSPPLPVRLVSSSPPVVISSASPAVSRTQLVRFRCRFCRMNPSELRLSVVYAALMHQSGLFPTDFNDRPRPTRTILRHPIKGTPLKLGGRGRILEGLGKAEHRAVAQPGSAPEWGFLRSGFWPELTAHIGSRHGRSPT